MPGPISCHHERVKFRTVVRGRHLRNINVRQATQGTATRAGAGQRCDLSPETGRTEAALCRHHGGSQGTCTPRPGGAHDVYTTFRQVGQLRALISPPGTFPANQFGCKAGRVALGNEQLGCGAGHHRSQVTSRLQERSGRTCKHSPSSGWRQQWARKATLTAAGVHGKVTVLCDLGQDATLLSLRFLSCETSNSTCLTGSMCGSRVTHREVLYVLRSRTGALLLQRRAGEGTELVLSHHRGSSGWETRSQLKQLWER